MSVSKFMLAGPEADAVKVIGVLDATYRLSLKEAMGTVEIGLEDTPAEARTAVSANNLARVFRVTVEEVQ